MSKTIAGVPETISRAQYTHLIESVGFTAHMLSGLRFAPDGIYATVVEPDPARMIEGSDLAAVTPDGDEFARHTIFIPVVNEKGFAA